MAKNSLINTLVALVMCMAFLAMPAGNVQAAATTVTGISPNSGHQGDAISATITGTGFTGATRVRIKDGYGNDIIYAYTGGFTIDSDTQISISFTIPAGATPGPGDVRVYVSGSWYYLSSGFTVLGPIIDDENPSSGKQGQTLTVVITGHNFTGASAVTFSGTGVTATGFTVDSATQITANVVIAADATLSSRGVSVTTPDGTCTDSGAFTIFLASSPGWVTGIAVMDDSDSPSIALNSDSHPHISYTCRTTVGWKLKYASYDGSTWSSVTVDNSTDSVGLGSSLALDSSGNPHISYYDETNGDLKYAWWTGAAWQTVVVEDGTLPYGVGFDGTSLALDGSGNPHISYYDYTNGCLKYAKCTGAPSVPGNWVTINVPDAWGGRGSSIALDAAGYPHISYKNGTPYYVYKSGAGWQSPQQVGAENGWYPSLALDGSGNPHISYGPGSGIIKYASNPPTWDDIKDVKSTNMGSARSSLALDSSVNQYPHILYYDQNEPTYLGYTSYNGSTWSYQVVDGGRFWNVGSLALDSNNVPHVAYATNTPSLNYAYYVPPVTPTVTAINPSIGTQGQTLAVTITGTNFTDPSTVAFSGTGITVNGVTFGSATQLTANITISGSAATTARNVTVTVTGGGTGTGNNLFTVTVPTPTPTPTISSVSPNSGMWGETLAVIITGANFTGSASVSFGPGITVAFTVVSPTQINATITIAVGTAIGARNISITTPQGTGTNSFMVNLNPSFTSGPQSHGGGGGSGGSGGGSGTGNQGISPVSMPNIVVQSATISNARVAPGETVTITANLANKGTTNGTSAVKIYVNGQEEAVQGVTVNSGSNRPISFTLSRNEPGTYTVYVGGMQAGSFTVAQAADPNIVLLISIALVMAGLVLGAIYIRRRQNYY